MVPSLALCAGDEQGACGYAEVPGLRGGVPPLLRPNRIGISDLSDVGVSAKIVINKRLIRKLATNKVARRRRVPCVGQ